MHTRTDGRTKFMYDLFGSIKLMYSTHLKTKTLVVWFTVVGKERGFILINQRNPLK